MTKNSIRQCIPNNRIIETCSQEKNTSSPVFPGNNTYYSFLLETHSAHFHIIGFNTHLTQDCRKFYFVRPCEKRRWNLYLGRVASNPGSVTYLHKLKQLTQAQSPSVSSSAKWETWMNLKDRMLNEIRPTSIA